MITRKQIKKLIEEVEKDLRECWETLEVLKSAKLPADFLSELLAFQPLLARSIFRLDEQYRNIRADERRIINRKKELTPSWFRSTLKNYKEYRNVISHTTNLARSLGDAFAWFFYHRDLDLLVEHSKHEKISNTPPGVGGRGELEFITRVTGIDRQLLIYHGNTTFLRIGDVSFIDTDTLRVSAIAELKSTYETPEVITISAHFVGNNLPIQFPSLFSTNSSEEREEAPAPASLPQHMVDNLKRQIREIVTFLNPKKPTEKRDLLDGYHIAELQQLAGKLATAATVYQRIGDGLLLIGLRDTWTNSLWERLSRSHAKGIARRTEGVVSQTLLLIDKGSDANAIYTNNLSVETVLGGTPIFWWPVDSRFLRQLYFQEVVIATIYNPAHLVRKLRKLGFSVTHDAGKRFKFSRKVGDGEMHLERASYFMHSIQVHLLREDAVVDLVQSVVERLERGDFPLDSGRLNIHFQIFHHLI